MGLRDRCSPRTEGRVVRAGSLEPEETGRQGDCSQGWGRGEPVGVKGGHLEVIWPWAVQASMKPEGPGRQGCPVEAGVPQG